MSSPPPHHSFRRVHACDLPIFRQDHALTALFYAPGYLAVVDQDRATWFENCLRSAGPEEQLVVARLREHALAARLQRAEAETHVFRPLCLTVYISNTCNLRCTYCFSDSSSTLFPRVPGAVRAGAESVARNCQANCRPFTLVCHGGGEPTLNQAMLQDVLDEVQQVASAHGLPMFRYIATNGVMPFRTAAWVAQSFDLVGLSCDGPPSIQARQRPLLSGADTSRFVERTAHIVRDAGRALHCRVTVTPQSSDCQTEIAEYLCEHIRPQEINVEPVYQGGRAEAGDVFGVDQAQAFVNEFLKARTVAQRYGIAWTTSGSRPAELHGAYCNVFRDVLNVLPDGTATACFKVANTSSANRHMSIGQFDSRSGHFIMNVGQVAHLKQRLAVALETCEQCFNQFHCARDCPDRCPLDSAEWSGGFRCEFQKRLTNHVLQLTAAELQATCTPTQGVVGGSVSI